MRERVWGGGEMTPKKEYGGNRRASLVVFPYFSRFTLFTDLSRIYVQLSSASTQLYSRRRGVTDFYIFVTSQNLFRPLYISLHILYLYFFRLYFFM